MLQKDYILRMIEMISELVAGILGLIKKGDFKKASQELDNAYYDILKQDASFFRGLDKGNLTNELIREHNYTNGHLEVLAELFYTEAELLFAQNKKAESKEFYEKSLLLFEFVLKESKTFSFDKQNKIEKIKGRIGEC